MPPWPNLISLCGHGHSLFQDTGAVIGTATAIESVFAEFLHTFAGVRPDFRGTCSPTQSFSRQIWDKSFAIRTSVTIPSVESSPVVSGEPFCLLLLPCSTAAEFSTTYDSPSLSGYSNICRTAVQICSTKLVLISTTGYFLRGAANSVGAEPLLPTHPPPSRINAAGFCMVISRVCAGQPGLA